MTLTFDLFLSDLPTTRSFLKLVILTQGTILFNSQVVLCLGAVGQLNTFFRATLVAFLSGLSTTRSFLKLVILTQGTTLYNSQVVSCLGAVRQLSAILGVGFPAPHGHTHHRRTLRKPIPWSGGHPLHIQ